MENDTVLQSILLLSEPLSINFTVYIILSEENSNGELCTDIECIAIC